jgi:hypothetical protein
MVGYNERGDIWSPLETFEYDAKVKYFIVKTIMAKNETY